MVDTVKSAYAQAVGAAKQITGSFPAVGHEGHENADQSVTFQGYAAFDPSAHTREWSYHPPKLVRDFVEIKIDYCGICGSDLHTATSGWGAATYPQIVGHEIVGTVTAVGPDAKELKVGDRVGVGAQCYSCRHNDCVACGQHKENTCPEMGGTYGSVYPASSGVEGVQTQGGYAKAIRVVETFAFKLPENISSETAGPLMCAGVTVYAPLVRCGVKKGVKVGVIGIGGLGHLGLQFASKLGADVTAISTSDRKKEDALKLGAQHFLISKDSDAMAKQAQSFDVILCTANGQQNDYSNWFKLLAPRGKFIMVGMPDGLIIPIQLPALAGSEGEFISSVVGPPSVIKEMLKFASENDVRPWIETLPLKDVNKGLDKLRDGSVKYRTVLDCSQF